MGFAAGFQVGASAVERGLKMREERQERERLREAMGLTPQEIAARPPTQEELGRAQAETQTRAAVEERMFPPDSSVQNRTGLFSDNPAERPIDASVAPQMPYVGQMRTAQYRLGGQTFSRMPTQQEIDSARYAAAANVIAERDPVAAMRMRREMDEQAYQARIRPEQEAQMKRQGLLTEGQIAEMNRNQARTKKIEDVDADVAQWQSKRLLDPNTNELRQPTMDDNIAALQYRATALQKAGLAKEATDSLRDYQGFAVNQIKLDETQRNSQLGAVAAAIAAGDLNPAVAFYDRYVLDGAKVTGMKTDPKTGAITVSRVRDDGAPMPDKVIKGGANELLAALNSFKDPMALYNYSQNEFTNNLNLRKTVAAEQTAKSTVGLRDAQMRQISTQEAASAEAQQIRAQFMALSDEDQAGAKGLALRQAFTMANAKAGAVVPLGAPPRAATGPARELSDLDKENLRYYRDWVKDPKNAKLPQGQRDAFAAELGVTEFIKRGAAGPQAGIGSNPYAAPQQGVDTTRAPATAAPAPAALTTENTKLLNRAGNTGYNVQLPDGTTQVMSISQLNKLGYQFPGGTGLQRAWYEDLLPRRQ